ncbi:hypothetical protein DXU04_13050 [Bradyrhizobium diazoefficiens]
MSSREVAGSSNSTETATWLVLKPHNREWTSAPRADDRWPSREFAGENTKRGLNGLDREAEPNRLGSAPSQGRLVAVVADLRLIAVVANDGLIAVVAHDGRVAMVADDGRRVRGRHHVCQCDRCESHKDVIAHESCPLPGGSLRAT